MNRERGWLFIAIFYMLVGSVPLIMVLKVEGWFAEETPLIAAVAVIVLSPITVPPFYAALRYVPRCRSFPVLRRLGWGPRPGPPSAIAQLPPAAPPGPQMGPVATPSAPALEKPTDVPLDLHSPKELLRLFIALYIITVVTLALAGASFVFILIALPLNVIIFIIPVLIWLSYDHHLRKAPPESRFTALTALACGIGALAPALVIELVIDPSSSTSLGDVTGPFVEELCKAGALLLMVQRINSRYKGFYYGVVVGMAFAMGENLYYGLDPILGASSGGGGMSWGALALLRSLTGTVGHGLYTGLVGYGLGAYLDPNGGNGRLVIMPAFLAAIFLHLHWNGARDIGPVYGALTMIVQPIIEVYLLYYIHKRTLEQRDRYPPGGRWRKEPPAPQQPPAAQYQPPPGVTTTAPPPHLPPPASAVPTPPAPASTQPAPVVGVKGPAGAPRFCLSCGGPFTEDDRFCMACGRPR
jgi:RsiW-degrading membrane proteinase PrsW (M82 family)